MNESGGITHPSLALPSKLLQSQICKHKFVTLRFCNILIGLFYMFLCRFLPKSLHYHKLIYFFKKQALIIFRILFYLVVVKICYSTYILVILLHDQVILPNLWLNLNLNFKNFYQWFEVSMDLTSWEWNKISKDFKAERTGRWLTNNNRAEQMTDKQINRD